MCRCAPAYTWWSEDNWWESSLSFHHVGPRNGPLAVRFGRKLLYSQSHLTSPSHFHSITLTLPTCLFSHYTLASFKLHLVCKRQRKVSHWCGACWLSWPASPGIPCLHHSTGILSTCHHTLHFYLVSREQTQVLTHAQQVLYQQDHLPGPSFNSLQSHFEVIIILLL